jgi:hypothetical protein
MCYVCRQRYGEAPIDVIKAELAREDCDWIQVQGRRLGPFFEAKMRIVSERSACLRRRGVEA